jgi:F-type H+-transporting ATPase subunit b
MEFLNSIFQNNLINWLVLLAGLAFAWNKFTPGAFQARKEGIESVLSDAAIARKQGEEFLLEQKKKVANADKEAAGIIEEGKQLAAQLQAQMKQQTEKDMADLKRKIESQMAAERQLAITELRAAAARSAIRLTEQILPTLMTSEAKSKLLSQFVEQLDSRTQQESPVSTGHMERLTNA